MINQQTAEGAWNEAKGKMRERWGELSDNELSEAQGNMEQLTGYIQRKTGETRETVENYLNEIGAADAWQQAKENIAGFAQAASETAQNAADQVKAGYMQTQRLVQRHPMEALAVTLGAGVVAGVIAGLVMRSR